MTLERPVFWQHGLLLQPQHFQLAQHSVRSMLIPYQDYLAPHFWGVHRMELRSEPAGTRSVILVSGAFLFPDGSHVVWPGNCLVESRPIKDEQPAGANPENVYLGLKKWSTTAQNVTILEAGEPLAGVATRFVAPAAASPCPDLHAGGAQAEVRQLSFVLKIFWESEVELLGDYLLIPIARLEKSGEGAMLSRQFIPPCLTIAGSAPLWNMVQEIRDQLASRCRQLEEGKRERGIQAAEFGSKDLVYLLALRTLNRYLAQLTHCIEAREVHPWQVYGVLRQLVAELSSFSETVTALGESAADGSPLLPEYQHLAPGACFSMAHDLVLKLLGQITAGPEYALPLPYDGAFYGAELKPAHFQGRRRFYLVLTSDEAPQELVRSIVTLAKLSSRERLPLLIAQALPGIPLEHLPDPPRELPRRGSSIFFAIDSRCEQWDLVQKWNNIALCWDQAPADLALQLMIVARS